MRTYSELVSTHTPGPWAVVCERNRDNAYNDIGAPGQEWPASTIGLVSCDNPHYRANCALIAAAPDMLAVLREVAENTVSLELRSKVYAAIAKATGEQP